MKNLLNDVSDIIHMVPQVLYGLFLTYLLIIVSVIALIFKGAKPLRNKLWNLWIDQEPVK